MNSYKVNYLTMFKNEALLNICTISYYYNIINYYFLKKENEDYNYLIGKLCIVLEYVLTILFNK